MSLRKGLEYLAPLLESGMMHGAVRNRLSKAVDDAHEGSGKYGYYVDHSGDGESGDCVYMSGGKCMSAPYKLESVGGKNNDNVDTESAHEVQPSVSYTPVADDNDQYSTMAEAGLYTTGDRPMCERFISKAERDSAGEDSFAGKGKSFPILKPGDVKAAIHAMGRAGAGNYGPAALKANITRIAKAKGLHSELPDAWKDSECAVEAQVVNITGDVIPLREGAVGQDGSAYLKLIAPGWGSSGYYSPQLLERDGPKVFTKGTKNFWNHQTDAEEAARPEGDLRDLASVLTEDAKWEKNGPAGAGLYARAKVFEQFRQPVDDLARHIGVSIRATGKAVEGKAEGRTGPIIQELSRALSADYVTTPGAGGQILQLFESARTRRTNEGESMTEADLREVQGMRADLKKLRERAALADAAGVIAGFFTTVRVGEAIEQRVTARLLERNVPMTTAGDLDKDALKKLWETETKDECEYVNRLNGGRVVVSMGAPAGGQQLTEAELKAQRKADKKRFKESAAEYGLETEMGARIFNEGRGAFDPHYNSRVKEVAA
jgi:hypothetical protein